MTLEVALCTINADSLDIVSPTWWHTYKYSDKQKQKNKIVIRRLGQFLGGKVLSFHKRFSLCSVSNRMIYFGWVLFECGLGFHFGMYSIEIKFNFFY